MVWTFVSQAIATVLSGIASVLPTSTWNPDTSGVQTVIGYVDGLNSVFPVDVVLGCIAVYVFFVTNTLLFDVGLWVYRHIPFLGGGS